MKRGKEEEKTMGPMFPRLHVNDTAEKGGPRAPPRNKMALYEQLSIPSQRFGSSVVPHNSHNNRNLSSSASSSQLAASTTTSQWSEKFDARYLDGTSTTSFEPKKGRGVEDDFTVPVFVQARVGKSLEKAQNNIERETVSSISLEHPRQMVERRSAIDFVPKHNNQTDANFGQEVRNEINGNQKHSGQDGVRSIILVKNHSAGENGDGRMKEVKMSSLQRYFSMSSDVEICLNPKSVEGVPVDSYRKHENIITRESLRDKPPNETCCVEGQSHEEENGSGRNSDSNKVCTSLQLESEDKGDDVSETSMVDSKTDLVMTPDEVVGIIGQKHFWKARKAIAHQQRVFAVQVFELHRLIKVQRLIAGSPHILLDDDAFMRKSTSKDYPVKNHPHESVEKPTPVVANCKDDSEKTSNKKECSTGNAVGKSSVSSAQNGGLSMTYGPYMGHHPPVATVNDDIMGPWSFHQPSGPQWLVPIMSPSQGLVYKPYPGPVPGAIYAGCGPFGQNPNYANSIYAHPHGIMGFPGASPAGHTYFPYGMPISNQSMSASVVVPGCHSQTGPTSGAGANVNTEQQSSCTVPSTAPTQKGSISQAKMFQPSKGSDLQQGSTASSRCEMAKRARISHENEGRDPLQLFPSAPVAQELAHQPLVAEQPIRAIKVVPHNPRSATESAARIFRSIQEERKQFDSV